MRGIHKPKEWEYCAATLETRREFAQIVLIYVLYNSYLVCLVGFSTSPRLKVNED